MSFTVDVKLDDSKSFDYARLSITTSKFHGISFAS